MSTGRMDTMKPQDPEELVILEALRLTPREREIILDVLRRDEVLRKRNQQRVMRLKSELQALRRRGALRPSSQPTPTLPIASTTNPEYWSGGVASIGCTSSSTAPAPITILGGGGVTATTNQLQQVVTTLPLSSSSERSCARCRVELGRIINRGAICRTCRQRVCKACREYSSKTTDWVCCVCHKHMEIQAATGEWIHEFKRRSSIRRDSRTSINLQPAADIIKRTIRRSWTISNPQPRWSYLRGSSESRPYNSLPRGQDVESFASLAPYQQTTTNQSPTASTSPIPSPIPSPLLLREPPSSPQPQLSPRLLSPRNHSQELRRSYTDGQSIYISPLLRQRSPKREPSPELFIRPTIEVDDVLKKPLKSPSCSSGGRISPRRSPLQKEFPGRYQGRVLPESLNISQSKIDTPPRRISPLAKAYSEEPKIPPQSPQHRPELKSFSSQGSQDLPKPPNNLPPSKFFQEIAKKMATTEAAAQSKSSSSKPLSPRTKFKTRNNDFFDCIDSVPKFAPRRLGGSTTSFEEVVKAVLERKAANEEKSASFEKHVSFESSDPTSSRKNSLLYEKDDAKMKSESYLVRSCDDHVTRNNAAANENKIKSYSTDDKRYQPFNALSNLKSDSDPITTGAHEDLSVGEDDGDVEVLSGTLFRKVTVKRRRQEMKKTSAIDNGTLSPSILPTVSPNSRYHRRNSHRRNTHHFTYDQNNHHSNSRDHFSDLLTSIELDSIATGGGRILLPPDGEDYKLVFISSASDSSSSSKEEDEEEVDEADDEDFNDSCSNLSSPKPACTVLLDECDWDYFDTSFINTMSTTQQNRSTAMLHYWANSPFHSPRRYLTPSPIFGSPKSHKSRRGESDTGTDEDSVSRLGESSSESSNSGIRQSSRHYRQKEKIDESTTQNCCPTNCQNCGGPQKQYIPIPVPVPIPVPIPTLWNPQDSIILYNPDSTMDSQLQLRLQSIQQNATNMFNNATATNGIWLWPYCNKNIENPFTTTVLQQNIMNPSTEFINSQTLISSNDNTNNNQPVTSIHNEMITENNTTPQNTKEKLNENVSEENDKASLPDNNNCVANTSTSAEMKNEIQEVIPQSDEVSGYLNSENHNLMSSSSSNSDNDSSSSSSSSSSDTSNHDGVPPRRRRTVQRTYNVTVDGDNKRFSDDALPSSGNVSVMESSSSEAENSAPTSDIDDGIINDDDNNLSDNDNVSSSSSADDETDSDDTGTVADRKSSKRFSHVFVVNTTNNSSSSSSSSDDLSSSGDNDSSDNDTDTEKDCLNCVLNSIRALSNSDNDEPINSDNTCVLKQFKLIDEELLISDENIQSDNEKLVNDNKEEVINSDNNTCAFKQFKIISEKSISDENMQSDNETQINDNKEDLINSDALKQFKIISEESINDENMLPSKNDNEKHVNDDDNNKEEQTINTDNNTCALKLYKIISEESISDENMQPAKNDNQKEVKKNDNNEPSINTDNNICVLKQVKIVSEETTISDENMQSDNEKQVKLSEILNNVVEKEKNKKTRVIAECDLTTNFNKTSDDVLTTININNNNNNNNNSRADDEIITENIISCNTTMVTPSASLSPISTSNIIDNNDSGGGMNSKLCNNSGVVSTASTSSTTTEVDVELQTCSVVVTEDDEQSANNKCNVAASSTKYTSLVMITQETGGGTTDTTNYHHHHHHQHHHPPGQVSVITSETTRLISSTDQADDDTQSTENTAVIVHHTNWESDDKQNTDDNDDDELLSIDDNPEPNSLSGYFITLENNNKSTRPRRPVIIQRNQSGDESEVSDNVTVVTGGDTLSAVICLEEGLADDDSWVEDVSHDDDDEEFASTTPTSTTDNDETSSGSEDVTTSSLSATAVCTSIIDREEELRGYHRSAIDFTLHTIVEESCEESEVESLKSKQKTNRPHSATDLEKYFFYGLAENINGGNTLNDDSFSETSSIYSESIDSLPLGDEILHDVQNNEPQDMQSEQDPGSTSSDHLASSRLEKYFLSGFMGFTPERRDSDGSGGSVGSDSEGGRPSPEQRRKRLVRARGTGRSHSSSLDNLLTNPELSNQESSQQQQSESQIDSEGSSTETDTYEDVIIPPSNFDKLDGQFDTVKRKKCKKSRNSSSTNPTTVVGSNSPVELTADLNIMGDDDSSPSTEGDRDDSGNKTPQPEFSNPTDLSNCSRKQRDSGFVGSCDDLVKEQRNINETTNEVLTQSTIISKHIENITTNSSDKTNNINSEKHVQSKKINEIKTGGPPATSLTRKDSFNNWSSDEETNLMMSKMRQFFKTMVANSQKPSTTVLCTAQISSKPTTPILGTKEVANNPSPRLLKSRGQKPPQLIYFENELTRLMKTVPGIRDDQVREIVEYLSSEDTWSDSYDSSDYTSSDLEGATAGTRKSALQQEISESCQQIINKFDNSPPAIPGDQEGDEGDGGIVDEAHSLNRETAFVYQKLVASFSKMAAGEKNLNEPNNSPPLIAKVMHHIGSRLVALMHEVSSGESHASNSPKIVHRYHRKLQHKISSGSTTTTEDDEDSTSDNLDDETVSSASYTNLLLPRSRSHDLLLSEARVLGHHPSSDNAEDRDREASSDYERFSWRGSFESALMATHDSRTKLTLLSGENSSSALALAAKRRSAGDLLFNSHKSLSREQLDRVRSCGSICEDKSWVTTPTKPSRRRRSSVPDATRDDNDDDDDDDDDNDHEDHPEDDASSRSTLPRSLQTMGTASSNSLPRLPIGGQHHFVQHSNNNVKSARYRPPGFNTFRSTNSTTTSATNSVVSSVSTATPASSGSNGPKRAVSAPGLQLAGVVPQTRRDSRGRRVVSTPGDDISLTESNTSPLLVRPRSGSSKSATPSPAPSNRSRGHSSVSSAEWPPAAEDDIDRLVALHQSKSGLSTLGVRSDSLASVYSGAGEGRYGHVTVRGQVEFGLQYNYKAGALEIHVKQCRDLAPVDTKRNRSDPYVKVYLLPDKSKSGKRKTKVKKHTLNPIFDEILKFHMTLNSLETRTLWLTVWHSDMFGRNDFLGEVMMTLENKVFDDPTPQWYTLQERTEPYDDLLSYKGDIIVGLKFVPPDMAQTKKGKRSKGALHVLIKEAKNLTAVKANGTSDPFCKTYLLPDKGRSSKQKTSIQRRSCNPSWNCTFTYDDVSLQELAERSLELTIWDHDRLASNEFLGGVRFSLGTGKNNGKSVDWMDATGKELTLWQDMLNRPNFWVEGCVPLRASLENRIS